MHKSRLVLNRPVYTGLCVHELSKHLMYFFYYNHITSLYGECCQLLYTDTDSLLLEIHTEVVNQVIAKHADLYDTSDYPKDHPLHSMVNKKVLGKMKDECADAQLQNILACAPRCTASFRLVKRAPRRPRAWKGTPWRSTSATSSTKLTSTKRRFRHGMEILRSIALALRLQAQDRRKWDGHTGLWAQRCNLCKLSSSTLS